MTKEQVKAGLELIGSVIENPHADDGATAEAGQTALNLLGAFMLSQFRCEELLQQIVTELQARNAGR